ncbi:hypothetical protein ACHAXN_007031 [Cyclotella atomus]
MSAMPNDAHQRVKETAAPSPKEVTASAAAAAKEQAKPVATAPAPASSPKTPAAASAKKDAASTKEEPARKKQKMYTPLLPSTLNPNQTTSNGGGGEIRLNFVQRLMELLEKEDVQPLLHWTKDGRRIVIEDVTRFSEKVMPRYFSDTKYKSFMVRVKRWGFRVVTPKTEDVAPDRVHTSKILECELFRRDKPDLCLLMGDVRRVDRAKAAGHKTAEKLAKKKKNKGDTTDKNAKKKGVDGTAALKTSPPKTAAPPAATAAAVLSPTLRSAPVPDPESRLSSQLVARIEYQRLENMMRYNEMLGRYSNLQAPGAARSALLGYRSGLTAASSSLYPTSERVEALANNVSLHSIERDIQQCMETIAAHQDRLAMLQSIKEMKLRSVGSSMAGGGGFSTLLAQHHATH